MNIKNIEVKTLKGFPARIEVDVDKWAGKDKDTAITADTAEWRRRYPSVPEARIVDGLTKLWDLTQKTAAPTPASVSAENTETEPPAGEPKPRAKKSKPVTEPVNQPEGE